MKTAINVYSVRDMEESTPELVELIADAGYDGIQFSGYHNPEEDDPAEIAAAMDEHGVEAAPAHINLDYLEEDLEGAVELYGSVGVDGAVIPNISSDYFQDRAGVERNAEKINAVDDALDRAAPEWSFHYHNHDYEFATLEDEETNGFELLRELTDVKFELDIGWAKAGGYDPAATIRELGDRAEVLHMKDMVTEIDGDAQFAEIGEGDVDMRACAEAARDVGSEWLVYEHDMPEDAAASLRHGGVFLSDLVDSL